MRDIINPMPNNILDSSKLSLQMTILSLPFGKNGKKFSIRRENTGGKGEIVHYKQFLLFQQYFQKTCTADREKNGLFGKGLKVNAFP